jgi:hypothetical protein
LSSKDAGGGGGGGNADGAPDPPGLPAPGGKGGAAAPARVDGGGGGGGRMGVDGSLRCLDEEDLGGLGGLGPRLGFFGDMVAASVSAAAAQGGRCLRLDRSLGASRSELHSHVEGSEATREQPQGEKLPH